MDRRYIALIASHESAITRCSDQLRTELGKVGLQACYASNQLTLFASPEAPMLPIPEDGFIVGYIFDRHGEPLIDTSRIPTNTTSAQLRKHIVEHYWGSYVFFQPDDGESGGVVITRDPSSCTSFPCVYAIDQGSGFITSDISLAADLKLYRRSINWDFVSHRMTYPGIKTRQTGLTGISELLPGSSLHIHGDRLSLAQAWSPWDFVSAESRHSDPDQAAADVRSAVRMAVRALAKIEGKILLELSGGLDSSIVASCLRGTSSQVTCFNLSTPLPGADERRYARLMADTLGLDLHSRELSLQEARMEFPTAPDSVVPGMGPLQHAINSAMEQVSERHNTTNFLSGGGGDTVFCYLRTAAPAVDAFREKGLRRAVTAIKDLAELHQCTLWKAGRLTFSKHLRRARSPYEKTTLFSAPAAIENTPEQHSWFIAPSRAFPGDRERIFDLAGNQTFPNQAPRGAKRGLRLPLLSQPVMEACLRTPSWMWISGGSNRAVARRAFADILPNETLRRRSKGTFVSYLGAVYRKDRPKIAEFLLSGLLSENGLLETKALEAFLGNEAPLKDRTFLRTFDLCMIENWVRHQQ